MNYICTKGHQSSEADYCSECGMRMGQNAAAPTAPVSVNDTKFEACPVCTTPRMDGARFCEVCRFDFTKPTDLVKTNTLDYSPAKIVDVLPLQPILSALPTGSFWAIVSVDATLVTDQDLKIPNAEPTRSYPLDLDENLVGRRNAKVNIHPEIPINDPSVSSRHLKICRRRGAGLYMVDLGSSNGTKINDKSIEAGIESQLNTGDTITIGAWTKIIIQMR